MLASQTRALRASEIRKRLAELAAIEEMNDEQRSEIGTLRTEYTDVESKFPAALTSEDTPTETRSEDAEGRELRSLIDGSDVGAIFAATLEHRQTDGHTAELQQHYGLGANQVPLVLIETRAVTPAPGLDGSSGYNEKKSLGRRQNWCHFWIKGGKYEMCGDTECPGAKL